jgi:hypothetical protein
MYKQLTSKYPEPELVMWMPRNAEAHLETSVDPAGQFATLMLVPCRPKDKDPFQFDDKRAIPWFLPGEREHPTCQRILGSFP